MIRINVELLTNFLMSKSSAFPVRSAFDFFKFLDILGFEKCTTHREVGMEKYFHSFFQEKKSPGTPLILRDFKNKILPPRGLKLMGNSHLFLEYLKSMEKREPVSKLEFARLKFKFVLEKQLTIYEHQENIKPKVSSFANDQVKDPEYFGTGEIAGYYGNISIDRLKSVYTAYLPIYGKFKITKHIFPNIHVFTYPSRSQRRRPKNYSRTTERADLQSLRHSNSYHRML